MVMALPPAIAGSVNKTGMIRAVHPNEIRLLPQIESAADRRYALLTETTYGIRSGGTVVKR